MNYEVIIFQWREGKSDRWQVTSLLTEFCPVPQSNLFPLVFNSTVCGWGLTVELV